MKYIQKVTGRSCLDQGGIKSIFFAEMTNTGFEEFSMGIAGLLLRPIVRT
jgi:hypothetical protein